MLINTTIKSRTHSVYSVRKIQVFKLKIQLLDVRLRQFHIAHAQILNGLQHYRDIKR